MAVVVQCAAARVRAARLRGGEGWSGECGRSVPSRQIVKPARRRRTRVAEENVLGACPCVHVRVVYEGSKSEGVLW